MLPVVRTICIAGLVLIPALAFGQRDFDYTPEYKPSVKSTSATDAKVRIHKSKRSKKAEVKESKLIGKSVPRVKPARTSRLKEARVYRRKK